MREYFIWLFKLLTILVLIFIVAPLMLVTAASIAQRAAEQKVPKEGKVVAVVELEGMIMKAKEVLTELQRQVENQKVKGVVLRIDSPGGAVAPSQEIYTAVERLKKQKPIVVSMGSVAASGGLYAALGASKIFCQRGTITGSIGVIMQVPNFRKVADWAGVEMLTIKSGELKDVGNSFREMRPEERQFLEGQLTKVHSEFIQAVSHGRGIPVEEVIKFADGRVILGSDALKFKLADAEGGVQEAARAVFDLLGQPLKEDEHPQLFYPSEKFAQLKKILESVSNLPAIFSRQPELQYMMY